MRFVQLSGLGWSVAKIFWTGRPAEGEDDEGADGGGAIGCGCRLRVDVVVAGEMFLGKREEPDGEPCGRGCSASETSEISERSETGSVKPEMGAADC